LIAPRTKTRRADFLKVQVARKVVAAGLERLQRRIERSLDLDERARRRRHAALDRQPYALRLDV
jgi:hypothetical protein